MVSGGYTHYSKKTQVALFSVRKGPYTVNENPTERNFRNGYWSERSYTNILIRFSDNFADVTSSTVLGYVSSYVRPVEMGQYLVGGFLYTHVFSHFRIISQGHNFFPVFFWYHYLADHSSFILHSGI